MGISYHFFLVMDQTRLKVLNRCQNFEIKNRIPRCKLDCHFPPLCQFSALQLQCSGQGTVYGENKSKITAVPTPY